MYCSEKCCDAYWSVVHQSTCGKESPLPNYREFLKLDKTKITSDETKAGAAKSMSIRLIACIGLENIKKTALENKPMKALSNKLRTRGFQDGKFEIANLEALLSLEDNFNKLSRENLYFFNNVSTH
jgi:hypothetical protein